VSSFQEGINSGVWPLVLLGEGKLREELEALCIELGLRTATSADAACASRGSGNLIRCNNLVSNSPSLCSVSSVVDSPMHPIDMGLVVFAGFRQIEELPFFYRGAGAFIHPAISEPWGLVINEAMASGLPILSSKNVGAAEELVRDGINGFTFDPENIQELTSVLVTMAEMRVEQRAAMGEASRRMIADWGPERFAQGAEYAARAAMSAPQKRFSILDRILLEILIRK